jgi:hypothetical protein
MPPAALTPPAMAPTTPTVHMVCAELYVARSLALLERPDSMITRAPPAIPTAAPRTTKVHPAAFDEPPPDDLGGGAGGCCGAVCGAAAGVGLDAEAGGGALGDGRSSGTSTVTVCPDVDAFTGAVQGSNPAASA